MGQDTEDLALSENIYSYMKAMSDIDEVKNDPMFSSIMSETEELVYSHLGKVPGKQALKDLNFVQSSLSEGSDKESISSDLDSIRHEAVQNGVYDKAEDWVTEFSVRKDREKDPSILEKKSFISSGLNSRENTEPVKTEEKVISIQKPAGKKLLIRYISLSAAALIAVMLLIGRLTPSSDPAKIYSSFYEPYKVVLPATRGENNSSDDPVITGKTLYRSGNYKAALDVFSKLTGPQSTGETLLLMGLSNLETGNLEAATADFTAVISESGPPTKDAKWYLGLTCLRNGNTAKASELFESLSKTDGFYSKRSQKILRRLR